MTEDRRVQIATEVDATGARAGFNEVARDAGAMAASVTRASQQAEGALAGVGNGASGSARNVEAAQRNIEASIQRQIATMRAGARGTADFFENLASTRGVDPSRLQPLLNQLRELEAAQTRANASLHAANPALQSVGVSAAQTAAAMRSVPAQFTDIVTQLQGGGSPLTILFQQGGQLRDMFGSAGGAARALGGYVLGLVNPFTVAAAAAITLGVAFHQGSEEAKAYREAIITSGNAAGTSADQLAAMAKHVSQSVGTQGAAAEALAALVGTGKVAADNLDRFATVAVKAQRSIGQSVQDTAAEFASLSKSPLTALEKLDEKYHFLTGAVYQHVKSLQDQGRNYEATAAAQAAYATAFDGVATKVDANLGLMQRGWRGVTDFAKGAWDAMLGVGREDTLEEKLAKVRAAIARGSKPFDAGVGGNAEDRSKLAANKELEQSLELQIAARNRDARLQAEQARFNAADTDWAKSKFQYLTRAEQLQTELAAAQQLGLDAGRSDIEINERLGAIRKKYADIYNDAIDAQIEKLQRRSALEEVLNRRRQNQVAFDLNTGAITEDSAIQKTLAGDLAAIGQRRKALEAELALIRDKQNSQKDQAAKQAEIDALDEERTDRKIKGQQDLFLLEQRRFRLAAENFAFTYDRAAGERDSIIEQVRRQRDYNAEIGLTASELVALNAARREELATRKDAEADIAEGLDLSGALAQSYRDQAAALRGISAAEREGFAKTRDPWVALSASVKRYGDDAANAGAQIGDVMQNAFRGAEDAFATFVTTGKLSFSSLANSILADLARIEARKAIAGIASYAMNLGASFFGGGGSVDLGGARADGGPVTGGISYLVGERGPEIFTPSSSGAIIPNHALGGAGGGNINITIQTTVADSGTSTRSSGEGGSARGAADALAAQIRQGVARETRQGGIIWNLWQGRA